MRGIPCPHSFGLRSMNTPRHQSISDDPGTILDSFEDVSKLLRAGRAAVPHPPPVANRGPAPAACDEVLYRSPYRMTAPRITICDDGSLEDGEEYHVRADRITIGRATGDIVIANDVAMSASHAEVVRADVGGTHGWILRDLGSSNGTFVRCRAATLRPGLMLLIGSKRYCFEPPAAAVAAANDAADGQRTTLISGPIGQAALPALVEITPAAVPAAAPMRLSFRSLRVTLGRPGFGNDIELDDLCVARQHAVVTRDTSGVWQMQALPSINGLWVRIDAVKLTPGCLFQCGEQRFRFHL